jgi:hypothetical protein
MEKISKITCPLFLLLTKDVAFNWTNRCQSTFEELKDKLTTTPILRGIDWSFPFHISMDASNSSIGDVLGKQEESRKPYAIYFISKNLTPTKINYIVTKKEFLAIIHAINKFCHYIIGYHVIIHIDHVSIKYLMNKPITHGRVTRWLLLLQEFDITIVEKTRKDNIVSNFISHLVNDGNAPQLRTLFLMSIFS